MNETKIDLAALRLQDALDLAVLVEEEAQERYTDFADQMEMHRNEEATRFFRSMAENEEKHRAALAGVRYQVFGAEPRHVDRGMIFDVEAPETGEVGMFESLRQALQTARAAEIKAHDFYVAALAATTDPEVQKLFTGLRDEEVTHRLLLEQHLSRLPPEPALSAEDYADDPVAID